MEGSTVNRYYKHHLSDFKDWKDKEHSKDWILLARNIGERCCIDETLLCGEVYTIFSNKDGHGKHGTIIAIVKGTKAEVVSAILLKMSQEERSKVKEVTMDFSDSMYSIVKTCFPNATIVIDCFHIVQRLNESLEEMRLRFKRKAVTENKKLAATFIQNEERKAKNRMYYRKKHPRNPNEKRGRKRIRRRKYKPAVLSNGDTKVELLTRSRNLLSQSGDKWGEHKKERARLLFELYPELRKGYSLICKIRSIFREKLTKEQAKEKLHDWYKDVNACTLRGIKAARDCIKSKENDVLNYFINRSTNAAAESLNSKMKGFRAQLHGVGDIPYFMYRLVVLFG